MYLGISPYIDFAVCAGLSVASAAVIVAAVFCVRAIPGKEVSPRIQALLRVLVFLVLGSALFSVAAVIGHTKPVRDANSILGYVVGLTLMFPVMLLSFRWKLHD